MTNPRICHRFLIPERIYLAVCRTFSRGLTDIASIRRSGRRRVGQVCGAEAVHAGRDTVQNEITVNLRMRLNPKHAKRRNVQSTLRRFVLIGCF